MKYLTLKLLFLFVAVSTTAQSQVQTTIKYRALINDSEDSYGTITAYEGLLLLYKDATSEYFTRDIDTVLLSATNRLIEISGDEDFEQQLYSIHDKSITYFRLSRSNNEVLVKDTLDLRYTHGVKTKYILNKVCNQAFLSFRGRDYEIFYYPSPEIQGGPFKFFGLKGIVLEVSSFDGEVSIIGTAINDYSGIDSRVPTMQLDTDKIYEFITYDQYVSSYLNSFKRGMKKIEQQYGGANQVVTGFFPKRKIEIYEE